MAVRTYSPGKVVVTVAGQEINGFADGTFVQIERVSDGATSQAGADGEVARALSSDQRHRVTLTLQQTSPANTVLSTLADIDAMTCGGTFPVTVQDLCGDSLFAAEQAWPVRKANVEYSNEVTTREWVLETGAPTVNLVGGGAA